MVSVQRSHHKIMLQNAAKLMKGIKRGTKFKNRSINSFEPGLQRIVKRKSMSSENKLGYLGIILSIISNKQFHMQSRTSYVLAHSVVSFLIEILTTFYVT